ncbi:hypothetical protein LCGC14_1251270 [marine sediment metagenome]|uniref:Uncharacterized protein n=1 Tax=marine sediment metagenome TaxID=412755 RepID=A0A0F9L310_9ZZZZ
MINKLEVKNKIVDVGCLTRGVGEVLSKDPETVSVLYMDCNMLITYPLSYLYMLFVI